MTHPTTAARPTARPADEWHRIEADEALDAFGSSLQGLTTAAADHRLSHDGPNELVDRGSKRAIVIIWEQLTAVMVLILIAAATLSLLLGKVLEASAIFAIVALFTLLGFVQEYRAERAIAALRRLAVPTVRVQRDGQTIELSASELVAGDVVALEAGNVVPADLRLVEAVNLRIQESTLTGESEAVDKQTDAIDRAELPLGDRSNLAYSGTQVTNGRGLGVVVATGMRTELGRIATLLQGVDSEPTPLQARLDHVGKQLAVAGVVVAALVVALGAAAGDPFADLVLTAISVAVAVIPEGLPAVVTLTLAIGAQRMLRRNALIRKLPAVETLGSVTVICSDKTGTLTQNRMSVVTVDIADRRIDMRDGTFERPPALLAALAAGALCNDAEVRRDADGELELIGDPTETSLLVAAEDAGIDVVALRAALPRIAEIPFDSARKRMNTLHGPVDGVPPGWLDVVPARAPVAFAKGAIDVLLGRITHVLDGQTPVPMTPEWKDRIESTNDALAADGMRVLGVAFRTSSDPTDTDAADRELTLLGLIGIIDPPRPEAREAVAVCGRAGIRTVMITGDHPVTASVIAQDLGIASDSRVVTGAEIDRLDDAALDEAARTTSVFARVSPEHKLRIVSALRDLGDVVAMTGDGVNDAPALKRADIGVAMGITGTDVSKEAADMVLRDDNFVTIVAAVEEGRVIYDNLRRFVKFAVAGNVGKIAVMLLWPIPFLVTGEHEVGAALLPLQLLWLNLMTDGLLGLSLGVEPAERNVMRRPPNDPDAGIWSGGLGAQAAWIGALIGVVTLAVGYGYHEAGRDEWQTMMFTTLAFLQIFQAIGTRSTTESLPSIGLRSNPTMLAIIAAVVGLQLAALYTPLSDLLDLEALGAADIGVCVAAGAALLVVLELEKAVRRGRSRRRAMTR